MKTKKQIILLAATFAASAAMMAFTPVATAELGTIKGALKEKPPVVYACDRIAYYACVAGGDTPITCANRHGCLREVD